MTLLKDREHKRAITHRIAMGRPGNPQLEFKDPKRYFQALTHFEITGVDQDPRSEQFVVDAGAMERLRAIDPNMRVCPIRVDSNNIEDFLIQEYQSRAKLPLLGPGGVQKMWPGKRRQVNGHWEEGEPTPASMVQVWCSGDGRRAKRRQKDGTSKSIACCANKRTQLERSPAELADLLSRKVAHNPEDGRLCPWMQNEDAKAAPTCKPTTVLVCRSDAVNAIGSYCRFRSGGHNTADELYSSLVDIQKMLGGQLEHVPLNLVLVMRNIRHGATGKPQPVAHVELALGLRETYAAVNELLAGRAQMLSAGSSPRALLASAVEDAKAGIDVEMDHALGDHRPGGNFPAAEPEVLPPEKEKP